MSCAVAAGYYKIADNLVCASWLMIEQTSGAGSADGCATRCRQEPQCTHFTYFDTASQHCRLSSACPEGSRWTPTTQPAYLYELGMPLVRTRRSCPAPEGRPHTCRRHRR